MNNRLSTALRVAAALLVFAWYAFLLVSTAHVTNAHAANERVERVERYGSQVESSKHTKDLPENSIDLDGTATGTALATWAFNHYELGHDLARSPACDLTFYAIGLRASSERRDASIRIVLNDRALRTVHFSTRLAASFPFPPGTLVPDNVSIGSIELAPLDRAYAIETPVESSFCHADHWTLRIETRHADWKITHVGLIGRFTPSRTPLLGASAVDGMVAVLELLALLACLVCVFWEVSARFGIPMLLVVTLVAAVAPLTHDQWDFPIWLRFVDLVAYGHGSPAAMWFGTPLWAFLPALFAPVLAASNVYFSDGSQDVTVILLKAAMAVAAIYNASTIATFAPRKLQRLLFTIALASPIALYQLGAGYREVFAAAFALAGFRWAARGRLFGATLAFAAGASVSESLLPLVAYPAALALLAPGDRTRTYLRAAAFAATGFGLIAVQWLTLVPSDLAKTAISTRVVSYRYGGGSWYAGLDSLGLLPQWVGPHSFLVVGIVFALLACWPARNVLVAISHRRADAPEIVVRAFTSFVVAFFLSYRGVDPSTWYTLFVVTAVYYARVDPTNPFPLLLGAMQGMAFYAILGLGDFVNWTFLWPHDYGLLGILGRPVDALVLASNALVAVLYLALTTPLSARTFSERSIWFVTLFFGAMANSAISLYPADAVFCTAASAIAVSTIALMLRARVRHIAVVSDRFDILSAVGFVVCVVCGAAGGSTNPAAALVALAGVLLAFRGGFGLVDVVLVAGACLLLALQRGFGYFSIAGWCVLALVTLFAILTASRRPGISST